MEGKREEEEGGMKRERGERERDSIFNQWIKIHFLAGYVNGQEKKCNCMFKCCNICFESKKPLTYRGNYIAV